MEREIIRKILTGCGTVFQILYFYFTVLSCGRYEYTEEGYGKAFLYMIFSILVLIPCLAIFLADTIWSYAKNRRSFDLLRLIAVLLSVPVAMFCIGYGLVVTILWNGYFLGVLALNIVSFFLKGRSESAPPIDYESLHLDMPPSSEDVRNRKKTETLPAGAEVLAKIFTILGMALQFCSLRYLILAYRASDFAGPGARFSSVASVFLTCGILLYLVEAILSFVREKWALTRIKLIAVGVCMPLAFLTTATLLSVPIFWSLWLLLLFSLELISLFLKKPRKEAKTDSNGMRR